MEEDTNRAYGVLMENGDYHTAPIVISDAGGSNTYERLLDAKCMCGTPRAAARVFPPLSGLRHRVGRRGLPCLADMAREGFALSSVCTQRPTPRQLCHLYLPTRRYCQSGSAAQGALRRPLQQPHDGICQVRGHPHKPCYPVCRVGLSVSDRAL